MSIGGYFRCLGGVVKEGVFLVSMLESHFIKSLLRYILEKCPFNSVLLRYLL